MMVMISLWHMADTTSANLTNRRPASSLELLEMLHTSWKQVEGWDPSTCFPFCMHFWLEVKYGVIYFSSCLSVTIVCRCLHNVLSAKERAPLSLSYVYRVQVLCHNVLHRFLERSSRLKLHNCLQKSLFPNALSALFSNCKLIFLLSS